MKIREILLDAATVVGCCVGVGFISGKEQQVFFGNMANVAVFFAVFFLLNVLVRAYARKNRCFDVSTLFDSCFGRGAGFFYTLFLLCCFVCVVTMLAGVQNCLQSFLWNTTLPLYAMICAGISVAVLKRGLHALKILNVVSLLLAFAYFALIAALTPNNYRPIGVGSTETVKYALFSVTMSLGILAPLSDTTVKNNLVASGVASAVLSLLVIAVLFLANFSLELPMIGKTNSVALNILSGVCITLATVTGVVANALPVTNCVKNLFEDDGLCYACFFCLAVAFCMFGFDFALKYGYMFVAVVGILLVGALVAKTASEKVKDVAGKKTAKAQKRQFDS